jgi:hypothetical protein
MAVGPLPAASGPVDAVLGSAPPCGLNSDEIVGCGCASTPLCDPTPMPLGSDKSHATATRTVYKVTDVTPSPI